MKAETIYKLLKDITEAQKQILESNCKILEDINEAEEKIKEYNNDQKTTV